MPLSATSELQHDMKSESGVPTVSSSKPNAAG